MLIDTHCHLNFKAFKSNVNYIIADAIKAGVTKIIVPGSNLEISLKAVELAQKYKEVYAAVGIHPHHALQINNQSANWRTKIKSELKKLANNKKVVAIGECGLDYYHYQEPQYHECKIDKNFKKIQKEVFLMQIDLAKELKLPLIIHNRQAATDILKLITNHPAFAPPSPKWLRRLSKATAGKHSLFTNITGVFHCFEGEIKILNWALKHNFYLGLTGLITYNLNSINFVKNIPLERIIIETDSPYLMPEPLRQTKKWPNEPKNVKIIAGFLAKLKKESFTTIAKQTTINALQLFKLKE